MQAPGLLWKRHDCRKEQQQQQQQPHKFTSAAVATTFVPTAQSYGMHAFVGLTVTAATGTPGKSILRDASWR